MFKLLRKYNKLLLSIFGVLLMITFLIPQAISRFSQQSGASSASVATIGNGDTISGETWGRVQREVQFLHRIPGITFPGVDSSQQLKPEHWFLLTREADEAGLIGAGSSIDMPESNLQQFALMGGERDLNFVREIIAKVVGVGEMLTMYRGVNAYSDRQLKGAAKRMLNQVVAQIVVIEAAKDAGTQPTEDEIAAHFAKYAAAEPGSGEDGFGYKLPNRVKLEWLHIPVEPVREMVRASEDFSTVAQRLHWRRFENDVVKKFPKSESGAIPEVVANDLLDQLTRAKMDEIAKFAADQLRLNRRGIPECDGYVVLPEDWAQRQLKFMDLAEAIRAKFGIDLPEYASSGDRWTPVSDLDDLGPIAQATTDKFGAVPMTLATLVASAREFHADTSAASAAFIQKDIAGPPLKSSDGSAYVFRIIDADPSRTPTSVDEVREAVVADLQRIADFKRLVESAPQIEREAESNGMLAMALARGTTMQSTTTLSLSNRTILAQLAQVGQPAFVTPSNLPVVGSHRETVEAVLDYAGSLPPEKAVGGLDELTEQERVLTVPVREKLALMVFRLLRVNPLTKEDYADMVQRGTLQQLLASDESKDADPLTAAFGYEALVKRNKFAFISRAAGEDGAEIDPAAPTPGAG